MSQSLDAEIQRNYAAFMNIVEDLLPTDFGKYALLHKQELRGVFDSPVDAARSGFANFGEKAYSIQVITDEPVDLGFMSNAVRPGAAPK